MTEGTSINILRTDIISEIVLKIYETNNKETIRLGIEIISKVHKLKYSRMETIINQKFHERIIKLINVQKDSDILITIFEFITGIAAGFERYKSKVIIVGINNKKVKDLFDLKIQDEIINIIKNYENNLNLLNSSLLCLSSLCVFDLREKKKLIKNEYILKLIFSQRYKNNTNIIFTNCIILIRSLISLKKSRIYLMKSHILEDFTRTHRKGKEFNMNLTIISLEIIITLARSNKKNRKILREEYQADTVCVSAKKRFEGKYEVIELANNVLKELYKK